MTSWPMSNWEIRGRLSSATSVLDVLTQVVRSRPPTVVEDNGGCEQDPFGISSTWWLVLEGMAMVGLAPMFLFVKRESRTDRIYCLSITTEK